MKYITKHILTLIAVLPMILAVSCNDAESYSDLLKKQEKAVNYFLANQYVETTLPEDNNFIEGEDAPYYKMDEEGNVYMQVIESGNPREIPSAGDRVYFRFKQMNILNYWEANYIAWSGNADNPASDATTFLYDNYTLSSTSQYGTGIQLPLKYVGYNSYVRLVLKAEAGFTVNQTQCVPYLMEIRYFKGEY